MKPEQFPDDIRPHLIPAPTGEMVYRCLECGAEFAITELLYTCPHCRGLFMLEDKNAARPGRAPRGLLAAAVRLPPMLNLPALSGIFRYYELIAPVIPLTDIIYLGEGHTPQVAANADLQAEVGAPFYFKNDGQNPSASFKDRGMAAALSYLNFLAKPARGRQDPGHLRLHRRHLRGRGPLLRLPGRPGGLRGDPAPRQGHAPATGPAPGQRRPGLGDPRRLRRLHEGGGGPGRQLPGGPAQLQKLLAHPGPGVLCL